MAEPRRPWTRMELLVAFRLYCHTPFGRLHGRNPEIVELARLLGRTPSAVAMKACNFASLDPAHRARKVTALANVSNADRELWEQFRTEPDRIADELETAYEGLLPKPDAEIHPPQDAQTEELRTVKARRLQGFFRSAVMASYEFRCCLSGIAVPELLTASHIIPWSHDPSRRTDPTNGLALNALYDRAFDRGLFTFDTDLRVVLSPALKRGEIPDFHRVAFLELEDRPLRLPHRFAPDAKALEYHREMVWGR